MPILSPPPPDAVQLPRNERTGTLSLQADQDIMLFDVAHQTLRFCNCELNIEEAVALDEISQIKNTYDKGPKGASCCHLMASIGIVCEKDGKRQHITARIGAEAPSPGNGRTFSLISNQNPDNNGTWKPVDFVSNTCNLQLDGASLALPQGEAVVISRGQFGATSKHSEMLLLEVATNTQQVVDMFRSLAVGSGAVMAATLICSITYSPCDDCVTLCSKRMEQLRSMLTAALRDKYSGPILPMKLILVAECPYTRSKFKCTPVTQTETLDVSFETTGWAQNWWAWKIQAYLHKQEVAPGSPNPTTPKAFKTLTDRELRQGAFQQGDGGCIDLDASPQPVLCCIVKLIGKMYSMQHAVEGLIQAVPHLTRSVLRAPPRLSLSAPLNRLPRPVQPTAEETADLLLSRMINMSLSDEDDLAIPALAR